ncbi:MAG: hypothetical protein JNL83_02150, partial [Myxococcales bacterium]|nr:hypothetical protein [Myxococcales bacterium]
IGRVVGFGVALLAAPAAAESRVDCLVEGACCFPRAAARGLPAREVPPPAMSLAVRGELSRPVVKRVLAERCAGVRVTFTVAPSGAVISASHACVSDARFPASTGVTRVELAPATSKASSP